MSADWPPELYQLSDKAPFPPEYVAVAQALHKPLHVTFKESVTKIFTSAAGSVIIIVEVSIQPLISLTLTK